MLAQLKHNAAYVAFKEFRKASLRRLRLGAYRGDAFCCPVCGTRLNRFKPIWGSFMRKIEEHGYVHPLSSIESFNYRAYSCPACDANDRERLIMLFLQAALPKLERGRRHRMVEFAPSPVMARTLRRHPVLEYRSADLFRKSVDDRVDITDMRRYADGSIDILLCSHVLEHIPDDRNAMRELFRVLRPGGFGIVMVPLVRGVDATQEDPAVDTEALRWKHYMSGDHLRQYGRTDFVDRLRAAGFAVDLLGLDWFGAEAFARAGVADDSILYVVRKPDPSGPAAARA